MLAPGLRCIVAAQIVALAGCADHRADMLDNRARHLNGRDELAESLVCFEEQRKTQPSRIRPGRALAKNTHGVGQRVEVLQLDGREATFEAWIGGVAWLQFGKLET